MQLQCAVNSSQKLSTIIQNLLLNINNAVCNYWQLKLIANQNQFRIIDYKNIGESLLADKPFDIKLQLYSVGSIVKKFSIQSFIPDSLKNMLSNQHLLLADNNEKQKNYQVNNEYQQTIQQLFKDRKYLYRSNQVVLSPSTTNQIILSANKSLYTNSVVDYSLHNLKCNVHLQQRFKQLYYKKLIQLQNKPKIKTFIIPI